MNASLQFLERCVAFVHPPEKGLASEVLTYRTELGVTYSWLARSLVLFSCLGKKLEEHVLNGGCCVKEHVLLFCIS